jgi:lipopolysaccharide/colanic/teichoic acid biosynthesis glycosyltransferase
MAKRLFDIVFSLLALVLLAPLLLLAGIGIRLSSPGPILYRARRAGRNGTPFVMHKFRTMHHSVAAPGGAITGAHDPRVFAFGSLLRRLKIDELPQLYDVLRGKMSIVGPRPEDPRIVSEHYTEQQWETLRVPAGLASPGSLYNYTHGDRYLASDDPVRAYLDTLLPIKLALETVYVRRASFFYDLQIIARTAWVIPLVGFGSHHFPDPPEMEEAVRLLQESKRSAARTT